MESKVVEKKQRDLEELLYNFARETLSQENVEKAVGVLHKIYDGGFRHNYSDFFAIVDNVFNCTGNQFSIEFLQENLENIKTYISESDKKDSQEGKAILKLYDHINLEILRLLSSSAIQKKLELQIQDAKQKLIEATKASELWKQEFDKQKQVLESTKSQLEESKQKLAHVQGETVAIISIFTAVTLAFTGGLSYISSAITAIKDTPFFKVMLIVLLCGWIIFNTIYVLLYVVSRMLGKTIESKSCQDCVEKQPEKCGNWFARFYRHYPYLVIINTLFLLCIAGTFIICLLQATGYIYLIG